MLNMKKFLCTNLLFLLSLSSYVSYASDNEEWTYANQDFWEIEHSMMQSPIDIQDETTVEYRFGDVTTNIDPAFTYVRDTGHSIQAGLTGHSTLGNRRFRAVQVHFHSLSEHTLDSEHYPMEVHFVHVGEDGRLAVIGAFIEEGEANEAFQAILDNYESGESNENTIRTNVSSLFPENLTYYHYNGSLTTPPLSENVEWYVLRTPITLSKEQIEAHNRFYDDNYRETQEINDRTILKNTDE